MNRSTGSFTKERNANTILRPYTATGWDGPNITTDSFSFDDPLYGTPYGTGFFAAIRHFEKLKS